MVRYKSTYRKWHFGQVRHGGKKTIWGFFDRNSWSKIIISYGVVNKKLAPNYMGYMYYIYNHFKS